MKWMKSCFFAACLAACVPVEMETLYEAAPQAPVVARALTASDVAAMQSPEQLGYRLHKKNDEPAPATSPKKASKKIRQPEKRDIRYFDKLRRPEVRPTKNGFYREIIGHTGDGRLVVQDFYQNDDVPFTSPYIAVKDAKLRIFGDVSAIDSRVAWYAPDGKLLKMAQYKNGVEQGEIWLFANNRVSAYLRDETAQAQTASAVDAVSGSLKMQFFYPSGALMAERLTENGNSKILFYYENGSAMWRIEDTARQSTRLAWDKLGKTVAPHEIRADLLAVQTRIRADLKAMKREKDLMNDLIE